ncbi:trypsin-like serine peptidase [Peredibacter starrii]|uniref:Serine protease n=1 Tax=Peredibacter starrii TaxID=28202 RepID=A0AAX4HJ39_9BACT|nr:serine protease [Peredibacter starrii]WPU63247.1 serine protease [Peredibacter starrii]
MKNLIALASLLALSQAFAANQSIEVVYGPDNRQDIYQVRNQLHLQLAQATAGMIDVRQFQKSSKPNFFDLVGTQSLERAMNICPSESFSQQPIAPNCSGFLVSPDTLITAGHCYKSFSTPENVCRGFAWVFGYDMKSPTANPTKDISVTNIYTCKSVVAAELNQTLDYAIIKLDRPVTGRTPLKFRTTGKIANNAQLVVIGHPTGLPTKVSPGAKVTRNTDSTKFSTNLDTFQGNSGSAVFDANTGMLEGILIQGRTDYHPSKESDPRSCLVVNKCDENIQNCAFVGNDNLGGVQWGEVVLRITALTSKIKQAQLTK